MGRRDENVRGIEYVCVVPQAARRSAVRVPMFYVWFNLFSLEVAPAGNRSFSQNGQTGGGREDAVSNWMLR